MYNESKLYYTTNSAEHGQCVPTAQEPNTLPPASKMRSLPALGFGGQGDPITDGYTKGFGGDGRDMAAMVGETAAGWSCEGAARPGGGRWRLGGAGGWGRHDVGDYGWLEGQRREVGVAWQGDGSHDCGWWKPG